MHIMLDLETLGTKPGCAIVSIGACMFSQLGIGEQFYKTVKFEGEFEIEPSAVRWWMEQSDEARAVFFDANALHTDEAAHAFREWFVANEGKYVWCHGTSFDAPIMDAIFTGCGIISPWKLWDIRDTRTLYHIADVQPERTKGVAHNALNDAIVQAEAAIVALNKLGWPEL